MGNIYRVYKGCIPYTDKVIQKTYKEYKDIPISNISLTPSQMQGVCNSIAFGMS